MILDHAWTNKAPSPGKRTPRTQMSSGAPFGRKTGGGFWNFHATENYDENESCFVGARYGHVCMENTEVEFLYTRDVAR